MKFIVFGLGHFGSALAHQLVALGHDVIGVDKTLDKVERYKHGITHTIALDSTNKDAVMQLPMQDLEAAIIAMGEDEGAVVMTAAILKQLNVKRIICRVISQTQKIVLEAMNMTEFVYPESASAERLAFKLDLPGAVESFQIDAEYHLLEVSVPDRYTGKTIQELKLTERYRLVLVTIIKSIKVKNIFGNEKSEMKVTGIVPPDTVIRKGDVMVLFGTTKDLEMFVEGR